MQDCHTSHQDVPTTTTRTATVAATAAAASAVVSQSSHALKQTIDHSYHHHTSAPPPPPLPPMSFDAETRQAIVTVLQSHRIHIAVMFRRLLGIYAILTLI